MQEDALYGAGHMVVPVENGDVPIGRTALMEMLNLLRHPLGLLLLGLRIVAQNGSTGREGGQECLLHAHLVLFYQRVGRRQNLRGRAVVLQHHNRPHMGEVLVKLQKVLHIGTPPGVDGLVRVAHHE